MLARIREIDVYSGHADNDELVGWIEARQSVGCALILTHGEDDSIEAWADALIARVMKPDDILLPERDDEIDLIDPRRPAQTMVAQRRLPPKLVWRMDWHNDLTQLMFDPRDAIDRAADEKARAKLLRRIRRAMEE
ncbi:MAG: MBL fold metallo-hydrolase RNA specificity domain-containing protein [Pseudomonadota bacterium]